MVGSSHVYNQSLAADEVTRLFTGTIFGDRSTKM
jgi:hypothetical protein